MSLWAESSLAGFMTGYFASYLQWRELGAQVKQGAKSSLVVFYKPLAPDDPPEESEDAGSPKRFVLKGYRVFNAEQVEGWAPPEQSPPGESEQDVKWRFCLAAAMTPLNGRGDRTRTSRHRSPAAVTRRLGLW